MSDPLASHPGYSLRRAAHAAGSELASRLAKLDLRQSDATLLLLVEAKPGITSSALGRKLDIKRANMVPILKRLEDAGHIEREAIDGKSIGLHLTKRGTAKLARALKIIREFEAEIMERVPEEHREHLLPALNAIWQ